MTQSPFLNSAALRFSGFTKPVLFAVFLRRLRGGSSGVVVCVEGEREIIFSTADMILVQKAGLWGRRLIHGVADGDLQKICYPLIPADLMDTKFGPSVK